MGNIKREEGGILEKEIQRDGSGPCLDRL
jgi:hypothetical protein